MKLSGTCMALMVCLLMPGLTASEKNFDAQPYVDALIAEGGKDYESVARARIGAGFNGYSLKAGANKIIISGREPGTRLEQLWIGPADQSPDGKNTGMYLDIGNAKLANPMQIDTSALPPAIVSGAANKGNAGFVFQVPADGNYVVWAKGHGLNPNADSFYFKINEEEIFPFDVPTWRRSSWYRIVGRSYSHQSFIYAWNATSPQSPHHPDEKYYHLSLKLLEAAIHEIKIRSTFPPGLWYMNTLEAMHMILNDPRTTPETAKKLLKMMRPHVEETCRTAESTGNSWADNAVNILNQRAAILALAGDIWKNADPAASKRYLSTARRCVHTVASWFPPGKPYGYDHYGSGFDTAYYTYDAKFLTRYYLITGDETARKMIAGYSSVAHNVSGYGHVLSASSPWWKHSYKISNTPYMPLRSILEYSRDPVYARLMLTDFEHKAARQPGDWLIVYYNTLTPTVTIEPAPPFANGTYYAENENGPALRMDNLNVVMPWHSWCESSCAVYYSTANGCMSHVASIILTAVDSNEHGHYPGAYSVVEQLKNQPDALGEIIGGDFIARAVSFRPALGGPALPGKVGLTNNSPWQRTDIWFADRNGAAGVLELKALEDNQSIKVAVWPYVSSNFKVNGNEIKLQGLTVKLSGNSAPVKKLGKTWANYPLDLFESAVKESNGFKAGETFRITPAIVLDGSKGIAVSRSMEKDGIYEAEITSGDRKFQLLFNHSTRSRKHHARGTVLQSANKQTETLNAGEITLPPDSLTVIY